MTDTGIRVMTPAEAESAGPPGEGNLATHLFSHGSLDVEWYTPSGEDRQKPHSRDEIYVVAVGSGEFFDGNNHHAVSAGTCIFVPAGTVHRFEQFSADFATWVFFYGPEGGEQP